MDIPQVVKDFQSLISAGIALATALVIAPRVGERFARAREYWTRRLDHAREVSNFGLLLRTLPEAPRDLFHREHKAFNGVIEEAVKLRNASRLLYGSPLHDALFQLLQHSLVLGLKDRLAYWNAVRQFIEAETRGDPRHRQLGMLAEVARQGPDLQSRIEQSDRDRSAGLPALSPLVAGWNREVAATLQRSMRRWAAFRPWQWPTWIRWERRLRAEQRRLKSGMPAA